MSIPSNWYENFFHGVSLDLWRKAISPEQTKGEADFLIKALESEAGSHLLDLPCGNGRLSFELAGRGYRVTGVDISEEVLKRRNLMWHAHLPRRTRAGHPCHSLSSAICATSKAR